MTYHGQIPYGGYWSTPFARWQGAFAHLNSVEFAAHVGRRELQKRGIDAAEFDHGVLGLSIPQHHSFYGTPWFMGMLGADDVTGPTINQACASGTRVLLAALQEIESGLADTVLATACDRTSNGPHLYYPAPGAPGGTGAAEDWVLDNFGCDPLGHHAMIDTAENVAGKHGIGSAEQHDLVLHRQGQYQEALANDRAFQKRYMSLPFEVPAAGYRKAAETLDGDQGIPVSSAEGLAKLRPIRDSGTVTFGAQTHPADGSAAIIVTTAERARDLSSDPGIAIDILGFGQARTQLAFMPEATIPAARRALEQAGCGLADVAAIKSHNPFAVNDLVFARETGCDPLEMNHYGCPLIWGHPQAPTALRAIIELIEELALRGGGLGLFEGCAAGDSAMAVVLRVSER